jgi:hypothetical protein
MNTLVQMRPLIQAHGITDEDLEDLARILKDPTLWYSSFAAYSVRGRAPAA